jgi:hypothetical protein
MWDRHLEVKSFLKNMIIIDVIVFITFSIFFYVGSQDSFWSLWPLLIMVSVAIGPLVLFVGWLQQSIWGA